MRLRNWTHQDVQVKKHDTVGDSVKQNITELKIINKAIIMRCFLINCSLKIDIIFFHK